MNEWIILLIAATLGSIISLIGGLYLLYGKWGAQKLQRIAVPFAAGALLAAAFVDLLPEALHDGDPRDVALAVLIAFLLFFVLERTLSWFHHHHEETDHAHQHGRRNAELIIIGDTLHNLIDGIAIGAAFLVNPATGIVTTIAIAAHEIPQEIGDFGLLLSKGMAKKKILLVNFVSALATVVGAVAVFGMGGTLPISEPLLLAAITGFFIYIAASDIIPTIHAEPRRAVANMQTVVLLLGVVFVGVTTTIAHSYIDQDHADSEESSHQERADEHDNDVHLEDDAHHDHDDE